jgi:hypothetical protein
MWNHSRLGLDNDRRCGIHPDNKILRASGGIVSAVHRFGTQQGFGYRRAFFGSAGMLLVAKNWSIMLNADNAWKP